MVDPLEMWLMKTAFKIAYVILVPVSRYKLDWNIPGECVFVIHCSAGMMRIRSVLEVER